MLWNNCRQLRVDGYVNVIVLMGWVAVELRFLWRHEVVGVGGDEFIASFVASCPHTSAILSTF